jgi:hypothetical protein
MINDQLKKDEMCTACSMNGEKRESQKERDHWEDRDVVGRTILKLI